MNPGTNENGLRNSAKISGSRAAAIVAFLFAPRVEPLVREIPVVGDFIAVSCELSIIGAFAPEEAPLLGPLSLIGPAMAMGNRLDLEAPEGAPLPLCDLYQVIETSDVPAGVVNIVTGAHEELAAPLAGHLEVDAVWSFSGQDISETLEREAAGNVKRAWVNHGRNPDWMGADGEGERFLDAATEIKTIWVPYGD